jgi:hypothetical protein
MHVKTDLLDCVGNVRPGESEVLSSTHKAAIICRISNSRTTISRGFGASVNRGRARFAISQAMTSQDIQSILPLGEKNSITSSLN